MRFLETIEGRSGENLTSAVLKFLLVNSSTMRELFVRHLRHHFPASKTPTFRDGIFCTNEVAVSGDDGAGRIDLLIQERAGMVLGLENKFWASFTDNQPKKYWLDLVRMANRDESYCRLVLLAPRARKDEIETHLVKQQIEKKCCALYWEDLKKDLAVVADGDRREVAVAAQFLAEYIERQVLDVEIDIRPHQVVGQQLELPNDFHYEFLSRMKTCLPNPESIRPAKEWIGVHFSVNPSADLATGAKEQFPKQWFGFLRSQGSGEVKMGIHTGLSEFAVPSLTWARSAVGFGEVRFVEIDYDGSVRTTPEWKERLSRILEPLTEAVRSLKRT